MKRGFQLSFLQTDESGGREAEVGWWVEGKGGGGEDQPVVSAPLRGGPHRPHRSQVCVSATTHISPTTSRGKRPQDETRFASALVLDFFLSLRNVRNPLPFSSCPVCAMLSWQLEQHDTCDTSCWGRRRGHLHGLK